MDWQRFVREWTAYLRFLSGVCPTGIQDCMLIEWMTQAMDATTKRLIERRLEANPQLQYSQIWKGLDREHGRDATLQGRRALESVRLTVEGGLLCSMDEIPA